MFMIYVGIGIMVRSPWIIILALPAFIVLRCAVVAREDSLGGDVLDLAWTDDARAFAIVSDALFNTALIRWSPTTGRRTQTLFTTGGFSLSDCEVRPDGAEVWVCNSSFQTPGVRVYNAQTGLALTGMMGCTLPPQGIAFDAGPNLSVPTDTPNARVALAPPAPNPARGAANLRFTLREAASATLELYDLAGRRLRRWTIRGAAGPNDVLWDLTDESGRRVQAGMVRVRVRTAGDDVSRSLLVVP